TAVTADGKRTAQFEHTVLVTETGVEVLTGGAGAVSGFSPFSK
ncbi:MAG: type I methionyl aminopeptidase, partial [Acidimicrobiaceae bacterium]